MLSYACDGNSQLSCSRIGAGFMIFPVPEIVFHNYYVCQDMSWKLSIIQISTGAKHV